MYSAKDHARAGMLAGAALLLLGACGSDAPTDPGDPPGRQTLELPVRVHVLSSSIGSFDAASSDAEVQSLIARVNEIWTPADIRWQLESIVREPVDNEAELAAALGGQIPLTSALLASILPRDRLLSGRWDVFLVRDLGAAVGAPGIFFSDLPGVLSSEVDPAGVNDPGRILAHELGHSLTLEHVPCTPAGNLMAPGCASSDRTRLTESQVAATRTQASTGRPTGG